MRITRLILASFAAFSALIMAVVANVLAPLFPRLEYAGWSAPSGQPPLDTARATFRDSMITAESRKHQNGKKSLLLGHYDSPFLNRASGGDGGIAPSQRARDVHVAS